MSRYPFNIQTTLMVESICKTTRNLPATRFLALNEVMFNIAQETVVGVYCIEIELVWVYVVIVIRIHFYLGIYANNGTHF